MSFIFYTDVKANVIFEDNFATDSGLWTYYSGTAQSTLDSGAARTYQVTPRSANFLITSDPLPFSDDVIIEITYKYVSGGNQGAGLGINDTYIDGMIDAEPLSGELVVNIWQASANSASSTVSICMSDDTNCQRTYTTLYEIAKPQAANWNVFRIEYIDNVYSFILNNDESTRRTSKPTLRRPNYIWIGNPLYANQNQIFSSFLFDSIVATDNIQVPSYYFSQLDPVWKNEVYDNASSWAGSGNDTIGRWGCALTSGAMVLKKEGVNYPNDGSEITPHVLNDWLNSQPDGYVGNGLVNWIAITRLAKESYESGHADNSLEYSRQPYNETYLSNQIEADLLPILNTTGHFVTAHGAETDSWLISDPLSTDTTELDKNNEIVTINTFLPSLTDLSYMMFVGPTEIFTQLTDSEENLIAVVSADEELKDEEGLISASLSRISTLEKPSPGTYHLTVTNNSDANKELKIYLYDMDGHVYIHTISLEANSGKRYTIDYNQENSDENSVEEIIPEPTPTPTPSPTLTPSATPKPDCCECTHRCVGDRGAIHKVISRFFQVANTIHYPSHNRIETIKMKTVKKISQLKKKIKLPKIKFVTSWWSHKY